MFLLAHKEHVAQHSQLTNYEEQIEIHSIAYSREPATEGPPQYPSRSSITSTAEAMLKEDAVCQPGKERPGMVLLQGVKFPYIPGKVSCQE